MIATLDDSGQMEGFLKGLSTDEWLTQEGAAADTYLWGREGPLHGGATRAFLTHAPYESPKLEHLLEITTEAAASRQSCSHPSETLWPGYTKTSDRGRLSSL